MQNEEIYNLPRYYDIAFSWDLTEEIKFLLEIFKQKIPYEVTQVLEPACGTGRYLVELPKFKQFNKIVGYDLNMEMVKYCNNKIKEKGLQETVSIFQNDMVLAKFYNKFDVAINMINSLGYITEDEEIIQHFRNTGENLKKDGLYIVHLNCAFTKLKKETVKWEIEKEGIKVKMKWSIDEEDRKGKMSYQSSELVVLDKDKHFRVEDNHVMRLWIYGDLKELIRRSGMFDLASIYDESFNGVDMNHEITGEMGNLYFVMRKI